MLESLAFAILLAVMVVRPYINELPFRLSQVSLAATRGESARPPEELVRVSLAMLLAAAFCVWSLAQAIRARRGASQRIHWLPLALVGCLAGWTLIGALRAVDVRGALTGWLDQTAILLGGIAMLHLARDRRRLLLLVACLAALAGAMGAQAIEQVAYEIPERIRAFEADPDAQLAQVNIEPGTVQARMFWHRIHDPAATGWLGLSNVFASLLIVCTASAAGLAAAKLMTARRARKQTPARAGDIPLPVIAAVLTVIVAALGAVGLALTRSKGGIGAGVLAAVLAAAILWRPAFFARRRRALLIGAAAALVAGVAAVACLGVLRGGLPGASLQVRWEYWLGATGIIRERPVFGVGPEGFGEAYLRHRLPQAAESTKTPHNLFFEAACQYGIPGAIIYLALLAWFVVKIARPRPRELDDSPPPVYGIAQAALVAIGLAAAVLVVSVVWLNSSKPMLLLVKGVFPAIALGIFLVMCQWTGAAATQTNRAAGLPTRREKNREPSANGGGGSGDPPPVIEAFRIARAMFACGAAGFLLHNLVEYTLWMPATATACWLAMGGVAGSAEPSAAPDPKPGGRATHVVAGVALAFLMAAMLFLWVPVFRRTTLLNEAVQLSWTSPRQALNAAARAAAADPLDGVAAADWARLALAAMPGADEPREVLARAVAAARLAEARSPTAAHARLLAETLLAQAHPEQWQCAWRGRGGNLEKARRQLEEGIDKHGPSIRALCALAEINLLLGRPDAALRQLDDALRLAAGAVPILYDHLGDAAWLAGRPGDAIAAWRTYRQLSAAADSALMNEAVEVHAEAVGRDPMELSLRVEHARLAYRAGRFADARRQIDEARRVEARRPPESEIRLTPRERQELDLLEKKVDLLAGAAAGDAARYHVTSAPSALDSSAR